MRAKSSSTRTFISERIVQLGGAPNLSPDGLLSRSHSECCRGQGPGRHDQGRPGRRAHRDRQLP